jgi:hypothetical protein
MTTASPRHTENQKKVTIIAVFRDAKCSLHTLTDVSEEQSTSVFRVEEIYSHNFIFQHENDSSTFLPIGSQYPPYKTAAFTVTAI